MIPPGRTPKFMIWRACERLGVRPFSDWENLDVLTQADMIAYNYIREYEDSKRLSL